MYIGTLEGGDIWLSLQFCGFLCSGRFRNRHFAKIVARWGKSMVLKGSVPNPLMYISVSWEDYIVITTGAYWLLCIRGEEWDESAAKRLTHQVGCRQLNNPSNNPPSFPFPFPSTQKKARRMGLPPSLPPSFSIRGYSSHKKISTSDNTNWATA